MDKKTKRVFKTLANIKGNEPCGLCFSTKSSWEKNKLSFLESYGFSKLIEKKLILVKQCERTTIDPYVWQAIFEVKVSMRGRWLLFRYNK